MQRRAPGRSSTGARHARRASASNRNHSASGQVHGTGTRHTPAPGDATSAAGAATVFGAGATPARSLHRGPRSLGPSAWPPPRPTSTLRRRRQMSELYRPRASALRSRRRSHPRGAPTAPADFSERRRSGGIPSKPGRPTESHRWCDAGPPRGAGRSTRIAGVPPSLEVDGVGYRWEGTGEALSFLAVSRAFVDISTARSPARACARVRGNSTLLVMYH